MQFKISLLISYINLPSGSNLRKIESEPSPFETIKQNYTAKRSNPRLKKLFLRERSFVLDQYRVLNPRILKFWFSNCQTHRQPASLILQSQLTIYPWYQTRNKQQQTKRRLTMAWKQVACSLSVQTRKSISIPCGPVSEIHVFLSIPLLHHVHWILIPNLKRISMMMAGSRT